MTFVTKWLLYLFANSSTLSKTSFLLVTSTGVFNCSSRFCPIKIETTHLDCSFVSSITFISFYFFIFSTNIIKILTLLSNKKILQEILTVFLTLVLLDEKRGQISFIDKRYAPMPIVAQDNIISNKFITKRILTLSFNCIQLFFCQGL